MRPYFPVIRRFPGKFTPDLAVDHRRDGSGFAGMKNLAVTIHDHKTGQAYELVWQYH
jgi:hypothetical protein